MKFRPTNITFTHYTILISHIQQFTTHPLFTAGPRHPLTCIPTTLITLSYFTSVLSDISFTYLYQSIHNSTEHPLILATIRQYHLLLVLTHICSLKEMYTFHLHPKPLYQQTSTFSLSFHTYSRTLS